MSDKLVLCYHALSESWTADLSITPTRFERQLELLVERGYRGATLSEAVTASPAQRTVAITFDDGYRSVIDLAFPIMSRLGLVGSVYVVTDFVGSPAPMSWPGVDQWLGGPHEQEMLSMDADHLHRLMDAGWEVGSHTRTHPKLTSLDDERLATELGQSREQCELLLGRPCRSLAYPYGDVDERVVRATGAAGYEVAGALSSRLRAARPLEWPRIGIYYGDDERRFRAKVSPAMRRLRSSSAWSVVEGARRLARRG